jgi:hypothetical protein
MPQACEPRRHRGSSLDVPSRSGACGNARAQEYAVRRERAASPHVRGGRGTRHNGCARCILHPGPARTSDRLGGSAAGGVDTHAAPNWPIC